MIKSANCLFFAMLSGLTLASLKVKAGPTDTVSLAIQSVSVIPNTLNNFNLRVAITPDLKGQKIDWDYFLTTASGQPRFQIVYQGVPSHGSCLTDSPFVSDYSIGVLLRGFTSAQARLFMAKDQQITVSCMQDVVIRYYADTLDLRALVQPLLSAKVGPDSIRKFLAHYYQYGRISAKDVNQYISQKLVVTDSERSVYVSAINNFFYFDNKVDFGVTPGDKGAETGFELSAQIRNRYNASYLLSCNAGQKNSPVLFWSLDTRLSTNFSDSLNYIRFSPVNLNWSARNFQREMNVALTNESDQTFTNKRATFDASFRCIIPNLVNLTTVADNRLRLKPIIRLGVKGYYDYSNNITAFTSGQGYGKIYYYVPVYSYYSLIINAHCFYDFNDIRNPAHKVLSNYSVSIVSELPSTGYKVLVKLENGVSDVNYKTGKTVMLGLLMDFLTDHKKPSNNNR